MKKYLSLVAILLGLWLLAAAAFGATPEPGTKCGVQVDRWVCSYLADGPGDKPAGWYTPSAAIPAGKTIYKSCSVGQSCAGGICWNDPPVFSPRPNHTNDVVLSSGARRAYCGTNTSHATEYWTF